jgi:hypothetical protein
MISSERNIVVNIDTIEHEILELEQKDPSWAVVERLSWLYTVKDHLEPSIKFYGGYTDFEQACEGKNLQDLMQVIGEHMEALRIVYPNEYEKVVSKINNLV